MLEPLLQEVDAVRDRVPPDVAEVGSEEPGPSAAQVQRVQDLTDLHCRPSWSKTIQSPDR